jgi:hypothetical protein
MGAAIAKTKETIETLLIFDLSFRIGSEIWADALSMLESAK